MACRNSYVISIKDFPPKKLSKETFIDIIQPVIFKDLICFFLSEKFLRKRKPAEKNNYMLNLRIYFPNK